MSLDITHTPKTVKVIKDFLALIDIRIGKGFMPILVSLILVVGILYAAYEYRIKPLETAFADQKEQVKKNTRDIVKFGDAFNSKVDGYLIPMTITFDEPGSEHSFRLPVNKAVILNEENQPNRHQHVSLQLFSHDAFKKLFKKNIIIEINGEELKRINKYFSGSRKLTSDYFKDQGNKNSYEIKIRLSEDIDSDDFKSIRFKRISLLITHRNPVEREARGESNLPD